MNHFVLLKHYLETLDVLSRINDAADKLYKYLSNGDIRDVLVCMKLAQLDAHATKLNELAVAVKQQFELRMLVTALNFNFGLAQNSYEGTEDLKQTTLRLIKYCDEHLFENWTDPANEGDRNSTRASLEKVIELSNLMIKRTIELSDERREQNLNKDR